MNSKKVAIIDYQLGNMFSVKQACHHLGYEASITTDKDELLNADYAILPGVGAFGDAMENLKSLDLIEPIKDFVAAGKPFMGVCLGLQLLFTESEEFGNNKGLNLIEGVVTKFPEFDPSKSRVKVPQIEWNQIYTAQHPWQDSPLRDCKSGDYMYFVHSFYVKPNSNQYNLSETQYGGIKYCSSIKKENLFACQFHPEKSGGHGIQIYKNWFDDHQKQLRPIQSKS
jgi:glutamine amidotransferase